MQKRVPKTNTAGGDKKGARSVRLPRNKGARRKAKRPAKNIIVTRSSGRKEKFDTDRLAQTVSRSGTPFMVARDIAKKISRKVTKSASTKQRTHEGTKRVRGATIRKMVAQELRDRNRPDIASSYSGEQPENTRQGRHELLNENEPVLDSFAANASKLRYDGASYFAKSTRVAKKS